MRYKYKGTPKEHAKRFVKEDPTLRLLMSKTPEELDDWLTKNFKSIHDYREVLKLLIIKLASL